MQTHSSEIYDGYDAHHSAGVASTRPSRSNLIQLNAGDGSRAIERTPDRGRPDLLEWLVHDLCALRGLRQEINAIIDESIRDRMRPDGP